MLFSSVVADSRFIGEVCLTELDADTRCWRLDAPLAYQRGPVIWAHTITVPAGYVTDLASVPRYLWALFPPFGAYSRAAIVHDYLCTCLDKGVAHPEAPRRWMADAIFFEAMRACGVPFVTRLILWAGVRVGMELSSRFGFSARNERFD